MKQPILTRISLSFLVGFLLLPQVYSNNDQPPSDQLARQWAGDRVAPLVWHTLSQYRQREFGTISLSGLTPEQHETYLRKEERLRGRYESALRRAYQRSSGQTHEARIQEVISGNPDLAQIIHEADTHRTAYQSELASGAAAEREAEAEFSRQERTLREEFQRENPTGNPNAFIARIRSSRIQEIKDRILSGRAPAGVLQSAQDAEIVGRAQRRADREIQTNHLRTQLQAVLDNNSLRGRHEAARHLLAYLNRPEVQQSGVSPQTADIIHRLSTPHTPQVAPDAFGHLYDDIFNVGQSLSRARQARDETMAEDRRQELEEKLARFRQALQNNSDLVEDSDLLLQIAGNDFSGLAEFPGTLRQSYGRIAEDRELAAEARREFRDLSGLLQRHQRPELWDDSIRGEFNAGLTRLDGVIDRAWGRVDALREERVSLEAEYATERGSHSEREDHLRWQLDLNEREQEAAQRLAHLRTDRVDRYPDVDRSEALDASEAHRQRVEQARERFTDDADRLAYLRDLQNDRTVESEEPEIQSVPCSSDRSFLDVVSENKTGIVGSVYALLRTGTEIAYAQKGSRNTTTQVLRGLATGFGVKMGEYTGEEVDEELAERMDPLRAHRSLPLSAAARIDDTEQYLDQILQVGGNPLTMSGFPFLPQDRLGGAGASFFPGAQSLTQIQDPSFSRFFQQSFNGIPPSAGAGGLSLNASLAATGGGTGIRPNSVLSSSQARDAFGQLLGQTSTLRNGLTDFRQGLQGIRTENSTVGGLLNRLAEGGQGAQVTANNLATLNSLGQADPNQVPNLALMAQERFVNLYNQTAQQLRDVSSTLVFEIDNYRDYATRVQTDEDGLLIGGYANLADNVKKRNRAILNIVQMNLQRQQLLYQLNMAAQFPAFADRILVSTTPTPSLPPVILNTGSGTQFPQPLQQNPQQQLQAGRLSRSFGASPLRMTKASLKMPFSEVILSASARRISLFASFFKSLLGEAQAKTTSPKPVYVLSWDWREVLEAEKKRLAAEEKRYRDDMTQAKSEISKLMARNVPDFHEIHPGVAKLQEIQMQALALQSKQNLEKLAQAKKELAEKQDIPKGKRRKLEETILDLEKKVTSLRDEASKAAQELRQISQLQLDQSENLTVYDWYKEVARGKLH